MRADVRTYEQGLAESRERARALIMAGQVTLDGEVIKKPGSEVKDNAILSLTANSIPYVSRGGLKLDKAIRSFSLSLDGCVCMDIGASTGGFTDCMLQNGALKVYAIDVGYGQLDWKLRQDNRVVVMERTNARFMEKLWFDESPAFASIDVAFISLRLILPPLLPCLIEGASVAALIKPQFEAGREQVKKGIVRDAKIHKEVCENVLRFAYETGYSIENIDYSPITGPKGNIEFLALLQRPYASGTKRSLPSDKISQAVFAAHATLLNK